MPRISNTNGARPEYRALGLIQVGVRLTPAEIDAYVGTGPYASKYVSFLRRDGFVFDTEKDGKKVLAYVLTTEPKNAAELRALGTRPAVVKEKKVTEKPAAKAPVAPKEPDTVAQNLLAALGTDAVVEFIPDLPKRGPNGRFQKKNTYTIDPDFDAVDVKDVVGAF